MEHAKALPDDLVRRYREWKSGGFAEGRDLYRRLAEDGQSPGAMIVSCCDSRVLPTSVFGAGPGDFFVHRNIANLVPPCVTDGDRHGTSAAIEYGVTALKVAHLVVVGHSQCGGVRGCFEMCAGRAPELEAPDSFVGRWIETLRPAYDRIGGAGDGDEGARLRRLEQESVVLSLENLMTFPFVAAAVTAGALSLHGLWIDIARGELLQYDPARGAFAPV